MPRRCSALRSCSKAEPWERKRQGYQDLHLISESDKSGRGGTGQVNRRVRLQAKIFDTPPRSNNGEKKQQSIDRAGTPKKKKKINYCIAMRATT